jgi:hypothetical protein
MWTVDVAGADSVEDGVSMAPMPCGRMCQAKFRQRHPAYSTYVAGACGSVDALCDDLFLMRRLLQQHQWIRHADDHDDLILIIAVTIA